MHFIVCRFAFFDITNKATLDIYVQVQWAILSIMMKSHSLLPRHVGTHIHVKSTSFTIKQECVDSSAKLSRHSLLDRSYLPLQVDTLSCLALVNSGLVL